MSELRQYLESFPEILYIVDTKAHEILYMNSAGKKAFPFNDEKKCYNIICGRNAPCENCHVEGNSHGEWNSWEAENLGSLYIFRSHPIKWDGMDAFMCIAMNISKLSELNNELTFKHSIEDFTFQCILEMHREQPYEQMFNNLLFMIGQFLDADRLYLYSFDDLSISNSYEWYKPGIEPMEKSLKSINWDIIEGQLPYFSNNQCFIIKDVEALKGIHDREYNLFKSKNTRCQITAPIISGEKIIGFIGADNPSLAKLEKVEMFFTTISYFIASILTKQKSEEHLKKIGYIDHLTKLYNRNKYIEDTSKLSDAPQQRMGVLYADLNGLKDINDKSGHAAGDAALCEIADLIRRAFGESRSYRVGGDEFVVICPGFNKKDFFESVDFLRCSIDNSEYSAAIGYQFSSKPTDINRLIKDADEMMYQDKKRFYRHQQQSPRYRHMNDLMSVFSTPEQVNDFICSDRFFVLFQPRFDANSGKFCAAEALVRYVDESGTTISPMDFVPEMETNDIIDIIDMYVFRRVLEMLENWIKEGKKVKPVSVNISQKTLLTPTFTDDFMRIWNEHNVPHNLIQIEISEDRNKGGIDEIIDKLSDLKSKGFRIAVDNFGYKYADLYLFADFKFDLLKLDKDLVHKIENDEKTHRLSASLAYICHSDNIRLVAEGVETEKGLEILRELGCDEVQGYLFDGPMPHKQFEEKYL